MARFKTGERVRIKTRKVTASDIEDKTFFPQYCGLEGEVARVYDDGNVAVMVDRDSLRDDVLKMHKHIEKRVKEKFLTGLSDEGRRRLTPEEKEVSLTYAVLVKSDDLEKSTNKPAKKPAAKVVEEDEEEEEAPARTTADDLDRAEEEYLQKRRKK